MIRRPPRSTRTDTRFPYTTLFRSQRWREIASQISDRLLQAMRGMAAVDALVHPGAGALVGARVRVEIEQAERHAFTVLEDVGADVGMPAFDVVDRSEERRVGKECVSTCRSRWSPYH